VKNPFSCTVLLKGPNDHTIAQMKDAVRDGLRAVKNVYEDGAVLPGAGAFEVALCQRLLNETRKTVAGRAKLGVQAFAEALLVVPKARCAALSRALGLARVCSRAHPPCLSSQQTLAENAGLDVQETLLTLQDEHDRGSAAGLDVATGEPLDPVLAGIYDNYIVKVQMLHSAPVVATQLLLVDEVMRAGVNMRAK
jgi:T-complex protein 1 subunit zeta